MFLVVSTAPMAYLEVLVITVLRLGERRVVDTGIEDRDVKLLDSGIEPLNEGLDGVKVCHVDQFDGHVCTLELFHQVGLGRVALGDGPDAEDNFSPTLDDFPSHLKSEAGVATSDQNGLSFEIEALWKLEDGGE